MGCSDGGSDVCLGDAHGDGCRNCFRGHRKRDLAAASTSGNEADTAKRRQKGAGDDREAFSCLIELN
jgi:hypothetical protein